MYSPSFLEFLIKFCTLLFPSYLINFNKITARWLCLAVPSLPYSLSDCESLTFFARFSPLASPVTVWQPLALTPSRRSDCIRRFAGLLFAFVFALLLPCCCCAHANLIKWISSHTAPPSPDRLTFNSFHFCFVCKLSELSSEQSN